MSEKTAGPLVIQGLDGLNDRLGTDLGTSDWWRVTQDGITTFAKLTGDEQWIHVDPERARSGPFGGPVAHGFLSLSLVIPMWYELLAVSDASATVNYGLDKVRFVSPVPVGARIRMTARVVEATEVSGGVQVTVDQTIEVEGASKPAVVARSLYRFYR